MLVLINHDDIYLVFYFYYLHFVFVTLILFFYYLVLLPFPCLEKTLLPCRRTRVYTHCVIKLLLSRPPKSFENRILTMNTAMSFESFFFCFYVKNRGHRKFNTREVGLFITCEWVIRILLRHKRLLKFFVSVVSWPWLIPRHKKPKESHMDEPITTCLVVTESRPSLHWNDIYYCQSFFL